MKAMFRHILGDTPKFVRIIALVTFSFVMFVGVVLSLSLLGRSFGYFLMMLIFYFLISAGAALVLIYAWKLYTKIIHKHAYLKLDDLFAQRGFCQEMADTLNAIVPAPTERDNALRLFILTMSENYAEAEKHMKNINEMQLDSRDLAMIHTAKIRLFIMTNRMEKAQRLFEQHSEDLDFTYGLQPELTNDYRVYSDDAFDYYMLAAAYALLTNRTEQAADYRSRAAFQLSKRTPGESQFYTGLMDLNGLYALGRTQEAYDLSQQLYMLTEQMQPPFLQSQKDEMRRALEQAKIFAAHTNMIAESQLTDRRLPTSADVRPAEVPGYEAL